MIGRVGCLLDARHVSNVSRLPLPHRVNGYNIEQFKGQKSMKGKKQISKRYPMKYPKKNTKNRISIIWTGQYPMKPMK